MGSAARNLADRRNPCPLRKMFGQGTQRAHVCRHVHDQRIPAARPAPAKMVPPAGARKAYTLQTRPPSAPQASRVARRSLSAACGCALPESDKAKSTAGGTEKVCEPRTRLDWTHAHRPMTHLVLRFLGSLVLHAFTFEVVGSVVLAAVLAGANPPPAVGAHVGIKL